MRHLCLWAALAALVLAVPIPADAAAAPSRTQVSPRSDHWEKRVVELTNRRRAAHGVAPLKAAACPDRYAEPWTKHLATRQVLVHQDLTPMLSCPHTSSAGENIAYGFETPRALVSAWMHSAGHRANILNPAFHRIGVSG